MTFIAPPPSFFLFYKFDLLFRSYCFQPCIPSGSGGLQCIHAGITGAGSVVCFVQEFRLSDHFGLFWLVSELMG